MPNSLTSDVVILKWRTPAVPDRRAREIATFLGADTTEVSLDGEVLLNAESVRELLPKCICLIADAETLATAVDAMQSGIGELSNLTGNAAHVFIYGFKPTDRHSAILRALSSGYLDGTRPLADSEAKFHVADDHRELCGQFSGLDIRSSNSSSDFGFVEQGPRAEHAVLIRVADQPFLIRVNYRGSDVFLVACGEFADLGEKVPSNNSGLLPWFSRLVPLMLFLRAALKDRLWHSERSQACFIIDDPLLRRKYGFLEYAAMLETMRPQKFSMCVAFIPWNYRRSSKKIAHMFSSAPFSLSVCVHGCDHTRAEFASADFELLRGKSQLALDRMQAHRGTYGLSFDDVMVFPQGLFSSQALKALDACGYLAAVNTTVCPSDVPKALTLGDLLDVAVTSFDGFPLFARHYPRDAAEFAFDLFLGKPAFIVEHHGYFRDGYEEMQSFVKQLNKLDEKLEWNDLGTVCSRVCLQRTTPNADVEVRFYTHRFSLTNNTNDTHKYVLSKRQAAGKAPASVTVNGRPLRQEQGSDSLAISLTLDAGECADIEILRESKAEGTNLSWKPTRSHNARVLIRRVLSEIRDDRVETNPFFEGLLSGAQKLRAHGRAKA
jgi:hypothetical protein